MDAEAQGAGRPDYGLDAPGLVRLFLAGGLGLALVGVGLRIGVPGLGVASALIWMGGSFAFTGLAMVWSSRRGKLRQRDRMLDALGLRGGERVLDVGCGRGLLLVGAARRVPEGRAVGIDLWSGRDLSDNRREATLQNAAIEGVADRVEVVDGDMRELPFEDASFDAVVACFSIHNVPSPEGRRRAVEEIARVLRPGGQVALCDLGRTGEYAATLRAAGMQEVRVGWPSLQTFPPSRTVTARKK